MFGHETPEAMMAVAKARHEAAIRDAELYRRLHRLHPHNAKSENRLRNRVGDWLISAGHRIKTNAVAPKPQPALVHSRQA